MKLWKRNAIVATVLVLICAGVYLNWSSAQQDAAVDLTQTLNEEQIMSDDTLVSYLEQDTAIAVVSQEDLSADDFAQIRLTRQESRDSAVELLQETIAYDDGTGSVAAAVTSLDSIVSDALAEAQIESLLIAKGFSDCVAYMGEEIISVAVAAPAQGLEEADVAMISDIITSQTDYTMDEIRIIEVK